MDIHLNNSIIRSTRSTAAPVENKFTGMTLTRNPQKQEVIRNRRRCFPLYRNRTRRLQSLGNRCPRRMGNAVVFRLLLPGINLHIPTNRVYYCLFLLLESIKEKRRRIEVTQALYSNISLLAPCTPMPRARSTSVVFKGPKIKQPSPKSSKADD